ncbi:unnamed protein product, partial [Mesorhabditis belari]|uniref:Uncharacterized protein n=1 Tax=Mesorhabditis belari TaxID=2138241 RepID=A0AAF3FBS8_9BILA
MEKSDEQRFSRIHCGDEMKSSDCYFCERPMDTHFGDDRVFLESGRHTFCLCNHCYKRYDELKSCPTCGNAVKLLKAKILPVEELTQLNDDL